MKFTIAFSLAAIIAGSASALSEREAVLRFFSQSPEIQLVRNVRAADSAGLEMARAGWLPATTAEVSANASAQDTNVIPEGGNAQQELAATIRGAQVVPGGGVISGSLSQTTSQTRSTFFVGSIADSAEAPVHTTSFSIGFRQPLLKNAWRFGAQDYSWAVKRLDRRLSMLNEKKSVFAKVSTVRKAYWDLYSAMIGVRIQHAEVNYAGRRLSMQRERLAVGTATALDTLSAALELLKARQALLDAEIVLASRQRELARLLDTAPDSLLADTARPIVIGEIPAPEEFVARVEKFDPQLRIFEALNEKHRLELARQRNLMLPSVDVSVLYQRSVSDEDYGRTDRTEFSNGTISLIASYSIPTRALRLSGKLAQLAVEKNVIEREKYRRDLPQRLHALRQQWEQDKQRLVLGRLTEDAARKNMEAAEKRFEVGATDNLTLLKARNDYATAAVALVRSQVALKKIEIDIQEITGTTLDEFGVSWE